MSVNGFFSGRAFFMSMFKSVFFFQHPPTIALIQGVFLALMQRWTIGINQTWIQIIDSNIDCPFVSSIMQWDKSALPWIDILNDVLWVFLQCREVGARATGVSAVVTATRWATTCQSDGLGCPLFSSALTHHQPVTPGQAGIGACTVLTSAGRCVASITKMRIFLFHPSLLFLTSSKEDRTVSALNICKHSSWQMNFCTDKLPHSFSCLFARVLWSTVQDVEKYNVKISVIWCPTNRLRIHFILPFSPNMNCEEEALQSFCVWWFSWHANITFQC